MDKKLVISIIIIIIVIFVGVQYYNSNKQDNFIDPTNVSVTTLTTMADYARNFIDSSGTISANNIVITNSLAAGNIVSTEKLFDISNGTLINNSTFTSPDAKVIRIGDGTGWRLNFTGHTRYNSKRDSSTEISILQIYDKPDFGVVVGTIGSNNTPLTVNGSITATGNITATGTISGNIKLPYGSWINDANGNPRFHFSSNNYYRCGGTHIFRNNTDTDGSGNIWCGNITATTIVASSDVSISGILSTGAATVINCRNTINMCDRQKLTDLGTNYALYNDYDTFGIWHHSSTTESARGRKLALDSSGNLTLNGDNLTLNGAVLTATDFLHIRGMLNYYWNVHPLRAIRNCTPVTPIVFVDSAYITDQAANDYPFTIGDFPNLTTGTYTYVSNNNYASTKTTPGADNAFDYIYIYPGYAIDVYFDPNYLGISAHFENKRNYIVFFNIRNGQEGTEDNIRRYGANLQDNNPSNLLSTNFENQISSIRIYKLP